MNTPEQNDVKPESTPADNPYHPTYLDGNSPRICLFGASGFVGRSIGLHLDQIGAEWIGLSR